MGDPGSWNRYAYVEGDPVNHRDPSGLLIDALDACALDFAADASLDSPCGSVDISAGSISVQTWRELQVEDAIHSAGDLITSWQWANPGTTNVIVSFQAGVAPLIIPFCLAQPEVCVAVGLTIYIGATYLPKLVTAIQAFQAGETSTERALRCRNAFLRDLKNCSEAYKPGSQELRVCNEAATQTFKACIAPN